MLTTHYYLSMGMDAVEIVLRTEELFAITIPDDEASAVRTVGDFYRLICSKLSLDPLPSPVTSAKLPAVTHKEKSFLFLSKHTPLPAPPESLSLVSAIRLGHTRRNPRRPARPQTKRHLVRRHLRRKPWHLLTPAILHWAHTLSHSQVLQ